MDVDDAAALLGLPVDASVADIHRAFLSAARRTHPDVLVDADADERRAAGLRFVELRMARDVLLAERPVVPVSVDPFPHAPSVAAPRRGGIGGSVLILLLLALLVVGLVSAQDAFRSGTVTGVFEFPTSPTPSSP